MKQGKFLFFKFLAAVTLLTSLSSVAFSSTKTSEKYFDLSGEGWFLWLDKEAAYLDDKLYLSDTPLRSISPNKPSVGWQKLFANAVPWQSVQDKRYSKSEAIPAIQVSVPGTVEEYLWNSHGGDYQGVSWWGKTVFIPKAKRSKRVRLHFRQGARMRAEVYVNRKLVHYNLVSMVPFAADISDAIQFGKQNQIAVRITDPAGNFGWADIKPDQWGKKPIPPSHGFGGIMGPVELEFHEAIRISELFVMNKPSVTEIEAKLGFENIQSTQNGTIDTLVVEAKNPDMVIFRQSRPFEFKSGIAQASVKIKAPDAKIWDISNPNLYFIKIKAKDATGRVLDHKTERFGFRWFEVAGQGSEAIFKLNGKRIVLRTAISWGYYPVNGMYATPEFARKHVQAAKDLGLNMLSFHRGMGQEIVLDMADELGLLYYAEPGGYTSARKTGSNQFTRDWVSEKWLRMVGFMRNHPSLVMYNMINEQAEVADERNHQDMADAHKIDPTRLKTYVSGWVDEGPEQINKLHMLPYDNKQYHIGWFDFHHARGWGSIQELHYYDPEAFFLRSDDREEIVFYGEEGAHAVPPLLEKSVSYYDQSGKDGWDGAAFRSWLKAYDDFLDNKGWRKYYPTVDGLVRKMGEVSLYYQGRIIENVRISDVIDGYAVNGFESERDENHSGVVDVFRHPKSDPEQMAYYGQPLYVAIKARNKLARVGDRIGLDAYIVNEVDLNGAYKLKLSYIAPDGFRYLLREDKVIIRGGNTYGQMIAENKRFKLNKGPGRYFIEADLHDSNGKRVAGGKEDVFVVELPKFEPGKRGAIIDISGVTDDFFSEIPKYNSDMEKLDYIVIAQGDDEFSEVPARLLQSLDGKKGVVKMEVFHDYEEYKNLHKSAYVPRIRYDELTYPFQDSMNFKTIYTMRFSGYITPEVSGEYEIEATHNWLTRLFIDDELLIEGRNSVTNGKRRIITKKIKFKAGEKYKVEMTTLKGFDRPFSHAAVKWKVPQKNYNIDELLQRVYKDGTRLIVLHSPEQILKSLAGKKVIDFVDTLKHGHSWMGGIYFNRPHPIFAGLPQNTALNWEYQLFNRYFGPRHRSFVLKGEDPIVVSVAGHQHKVGTAVGTISYGKGQVLFSTLDIPPHLNSNEPAALIAKKVLLNMLNH